jgi:hypothetical protein
MSTEFRFEHVFRAPSPAEVVRAYFDAEHLAIQDKVAGLLERTVIQQHEDDTFKEMTWSVRSSRQLPFFVKPLVEGGRLAFHEWQKWKKGSNEVEMSVTPQILGGRVKIAGSYLLTPRGEGEVHRLYKGAITADVRLIGGKVERGILEEFTKGVPSMAACTQQWLDARST